MHHSQLLEGNRYQIYTLLKNKYTQAEIAEELGVNPSTISRELARNTGERGYRPKQANEKAMARRKNSYKRQAMSKHLKQIVTQYLQSDWSPEQITGFLKSEGGDWVSHETIYQFILEDKKSGGSLYKHLRHSSKKRKKRYGSSDKRGQIKDRISIDQRPAIVDKRERIGDWEIDLIIGKNHKQAIVTIVDRLSLMTLIAKVECKQADVVAEATIKILSPYKGVAALSITADNGKEFAYHKEISQALKAAFYFAHPYSSWERGTNENTNGLIRQYLPKGCEFNDVDDKTCRHIMNRLNNRPRKCLGYRKPSQVFEEFLQAA